LREFGVRDFKYREAVTTPAQGCRRGYPGYEFQSASTPMGLRRFLGAWTQRSRRAATVGLEVATASRY